jgi:hypothetical protein
LSYSTTDRSVLIVGSFSVTWFGLQVLQQGLGFSPVRCVNTLGKPAIHRRQQFVRLAAFAVLLPQLRQARGGA